MAVDSLGRLNTSVTKPIADIHLTGPDLLWLGIDPIETDVVDVVFKMWNSDLCIGKENL